MVDDRRSTQPATHDGQGGGGAVQAKNDSYEGTLEDAVLRNTNQFHKWHSELEAACASEMEEKYKRYADLLNSHFSSCESILGQVGRAPRGMSASCMVHCVGDAVCMHAQERSMHYIKYLGCAMHGFVFSPRVVL